MDKQTTSPDLEWAQAKVEDLIHLCAEIAAIVLAWAPEVLDEWM